MYNTPYISELLDKIRQSSSPVREIISSFFKAHHEIGSKSRRQISEVIFYALRHWAHLNFLSSNISDWITYLETQIPEKSDMPPWVRLECPEFLWGKIPPDELNCFFHPADVILRAVGNRDEIIFKLKTQGIECEKTHLSPWGIRLFKRLDLNTLDLYKSGMLEVQDEGSQLLCYYLPIKPNMKVCDYCAGAGGKSLAIAQMMQNTGQIVAHDISWTSLTELNRRSQRSGIHIIQTTTAPINQEFDLVVADVPCSGTGTWRRFPDQKWHLTQNILDKKKQIQSSILNQCTAITKKGGFLCYMTCSLLAEENEDQIKLFLSENKEFELIEQKHLSPQTTNTDGFYFALLKKK